MSATSSKVHQQWLRLDWKTLQFVLLAAVVQLGAVGLAHVMRLAAETGGSANGSNGASSVVQSQSSQLMTAPELVGFVVVETILLVALWTLVQRLPAWVRTVLKYLILVGLVASTAWIMVLIMGAIPKALVMLLLAAGVSLAIDRLDLYWMIHNVAGIMLGTFAAVAVGLKLSPRVIILLLGLLAVWDVVAVWKTDWMSRLIGATSKMYLPIFVVLPTQLRIDMDSVRDWLGDMEGPRPEGIAGIIGIGDLALPAALSASAVIALPSGLSNPAVAGTAVGTIVAMVVLRGEATGDTLPAMPWVATGCCVGFLAGVVLGPTSLLAVLSGGVGA